MNPWQSVALVVIGVVIVVVSLFADVIGIGEQPSVFGWKQQLGALAGVALMVAGFVVERRRKSSEEA